jgi:hypothetical protein
VCVLNDVHRHKEIRFKPAPQHVIDPNVPMKSLEDTRYRRCNVTTSNDDVVSKPFGKASRRSLASTWNLVENSSFATS